MEKPLLDRTGIRPNFQRVLGDLPWNARHVRGLPSEDIFIGAEEGDERALLFVCQACANPQLLVSRPLEVKRDFLDVLHGFERPNFSVGVRRLVRDVGPDKGDFVRRDDRRG